MTAKQTLRKKVHPLADISKPAVMLEFIHTDGAPHRFGTAVNEYTGDRLIWFDGNPPKIESSKATIKMIIRNIRRNCKIIKSIGDLSLLH